MRRTPHGVSGRWAGRTAAGVTGVLIAAGLTGIGAPALSNHGSDELLDVIVRTASVQDATAAAVAVADAGGIVGDRLDLISGFAARVPQRSVSPLRSTPGVTAVTSDAPIRLKAEKWIDDGGKNVSVDSIKKTAGTKKKDKTVDTASLTGQGIGVALIDSGVAPVTGLDQPGKVITGPDVSFESQTPALANIDTFGHGTHMAGIIAGSDPATTTGAARFDGVAPGAHIISLKVAAADGASDVSQVIAAIDWVVTHRDDPGLNIRILNLSFGTDSTQDARLDPLSFAVEAAWRKGIVVVVSVGNDGSNATTVTMPAANPYVIAVGAADANGTVDQSDDSVATFSNRGNATRHADVLATGRSVVSLRTPGSFIDTQYPDARVADLNGDLRFFRGSGTSQAAAVTSGSVALLLQQRPKLSPDEVKLLLMGTADPLAGADPIAAGAGQLDIAEATTASPAKHAKQDFPAATGLGTLAGARGSAHLEDSATGVALTGEQDIFGTPWSPQAWTAAVQNGKTWTGGTWNGNLWTGTGFTGTSWTSKTWATTAWVTGTWTGRSWAGDAWSGRSWAGGTWTGRSWASGTWAGHSWAGRVWA